MPHALWCGKPCCDCPSPCALDQSMPCSPDCPNLAPDGEPTPDCYFLECDVLPEAED